MRSLYHADESTLKVLHRLLIGLLTFACLVAIICAVRTVMLRSAEQALRNDITVQRDTLGEVMRSIRETKVNAPLPMKADGNLLARFQGFVESSAIENKCQVQEFSATSEPVAYTSKFDTSTSPAGWTQVEVRMAITGSSAGVIETLKSLGQSGMLYEFGSLDLQRSAVDALGTATLTAQVELRVLQRQETA